MQKKIIAIIASMMLILGCFAFTGCGNNSGHDGDTKVTLEFKTTGDVSEITSPVVATFDALDTTELWQYATEITPNDIKSGSVDIYVPSQGEYIIEIISYVDNEGNIYNIDVNPLFDATGEDVTLEVNINTIPMSDPADNIDNSYYERIIMSLDRIDIIDNSDVSVETLKTLENNIINANNGKDPRAAYSSIVDSTYEQIELNDAENNASVE